MESAAPQGSTPLLKPKSFLPPSTWSSCLLAFTRQNTISTPRRCLLSGIIGNHHLVDSQFSGAGARICLRFPPLPFLECDCPRGRRHTLERPAVLRIGGVRGCHGPNK